MSTETIHIDKKKILLPKLRFTEFNGKWETKKFGSLGEFKGGGTPSTKNKNHWTGSIPWISSSDIFDGDLHNINIYRFLTEDAINESATKIIPANSVLLVSRVGVGKLAINKIDLCTSQDFCNLIPHKSDSYFLGYLLTAKKDALLNFAQGTSIKGFTIGDIKTLSINLPTLPEQQKIASFLSAVDEKTQQLSRKKELLEQYKKGVMQQLFSGKLRFKDENGEDYPDWERGSFSKFIKLYRGSSPRPIIKYITTSKDGVNWIKIGDTKHSKNFRISSVSEKITKEGALKSRFVESGEIILANSMSFGKSYLLEIEGCIYDGWFVLRKYENSYNKEFLLQLLNSEFLQRQYFRLSTGGVVQNISSDIVYSTLLFRPVIEEQQKIANFLSNIDIKIESTNQEINKMQSFKKGLLQQMFV